MFQNAAEAIGAGTIFLLAQPEDNSQFMRMKHDAISFLRKSAVMGGSVLMLTACGTFSPDETGLVSQAEKSELAKKAREPQVFGLTAYSSPNGVIFAGGFRLHTGQARKTEFVSDKNTTTPVIQDEGGVKFLIDSSSSESWLTTKAFEELKGIVLMDRGFYERRAQHVYDEIGGIGVVIPKMIIDELHIESGVFFRRNAHGDLGILTRWEDASEIDGVLGANFLRAFKFVRISLSERYVVFSATTDYPPSNKRIATIPLITSNEGIEMEAMVDGERTRLLVDIAGDFELATGTEAPEMIKQVSIGDAVYRKVEAIPGRELGLGLEPKPRIGRQLLEKYDLIFNNYGGELILERPVQPPK